MLGISGQGSYVPQMAEKFSEDKLSGWGRFIPIKALRNPAPVVSVIRLSGVIGGRSGPVGNGLTLNGLEKTIESAFSSKRVKAVALAINSPGGSPVQSALIAGRIRALADEKKIPVMAFAEDVAASGGYWLACAADEIYADENSIVGSIGVISAGFGFPEALARLGIERRVYSAGENKSILDPFRPEDADEVRRLKALQGEIHESFKRHVRARRGERLNETGESLFEGDFWTGTGAHRLGLIDGIGDLYSIMRARYSDSVKFRNFAPKSGGIRRLLGRGVDSAAYDRTTGIVAAVDEWSQWKRFGL